MADGTKLTYTANNNGILTTSNLGNINPNVTNQQIKTLGESFQDLCNGGIVAYATRVDSTKIIVTSDDDQEG